MARGFGAREAFTVQARTYPKIWRDGVKQDILKRMKGSDAKMSVEEARAAADQIAKRSKSSLAPLSAAQYYPEAIPGAAEKALKIADKIYEVMKNELPAHTVSLFAPATQLVKRDAGDGDVAYDLKVGFRSPSGGTDTRTFNVAYGLNSDNDKQSSRELAEAVEQLLVEHGMDREEIIDGKRQSIDARRRKED